LTFIKVPSQESSNWLYLNTYSKSKVPSTTVFRLKIEVYDSLNCKITKLGAGSYDLFYKLEAPPLINTLPVFKVSPLCKFRNFNYNLTVGKAPIVPER